METKSRYEVVSDLEAKKRELIQERDSFSDKITEKENNIKTIERQRDDTIVILNRKIDDAKVDLEKFNKTIDQRKETITELIRSIDESLARFSSMQKKE